jgi:cardiolipin synthase
MYIIADDALGRLIADALIDKAREGIEVRLIYDDVGCWNVKHRFFERMREEGIEVRSFMPVRFPSFTSKVNYRNHRKIIVIDGKVGFIGGMNIALRYVQGTGKQSWRDTMLRVRGGAVYALQRSFLMDWYFVDRTLLSDRKYYPNNISGESNNCLAQVVTSAPVTPYPEIMQGYVRIITGAKNYLYLETPYFLPNESVLFALKTAAMAGVDVRVICPRQSDARFVEWASRSYLREVMEAGVKVMLYEAGFLHSKLLVCDDMVSTCGSTNVDFRSFDNNFEANIFFYDQDFALRVKEVFLKDEAQSVALKDTPEWMSRKIITRLWESLTRMLSPLL